MSARETARGRPACHRGRTPRSRSQYRLAGEHLRRGLPSRRAPPHRRAPCLPLRHGRRPRRRCWRRRCARQARASRRPARASLREHAQDRPRRARECRSSSPCASLVILPTPPAMVTRGTGCVRRYFSMPPTKSPMSISAISGRPCSFCDRRFRRRAGGAGDMREARGARHVDAAMDRVDPGRAGIGHDDAGRAEDRQSADNAEPPVHGLARQAPRRPGRRSRPRRRRRPHAPRRPRRSPRASSARGTGLMAGSPGGMGRPGRVTVPTPFAGAKVDAAAGRPAAHRGQDQRAVGDVRIVAGVLDDAGGGASSRPPC